MTAAALISMVRRVSVPLLVLAALIALVTALVIRRLRPYAFGISERIFLLAVYVFYLGAAAGLLLV